MKYTEGNIVVLNDDRIVYIMSVNSKLKKYTVFNVDDSEDIFDITDSSILMKV